MAEAASQRSGLIRPVAIVGPAVILLVLAMIVVPLPAPLISFLFALNISAGLVILAASIYILAPTDFTAFPSILLITTLMRLALNVATARVILLHGFQGPDAAGRVIESFGRFVVGGNYVVGFIIFVILVVINFVVVTKGAGRVAEVSARFILDALPGKQMAIDADLNAGMLSPRQAEQRREAVRREADFFGAMDGASKFIRGDVIAAIIILVINLVGGLAVGMLQHHLPLPVAARDYTLLTIGDGLAAQIPSLTISIAAGIVVTRVATGEAVGAQVISQIARYPQAIAAAGGLMAVLGLVPGMAHWPFLLLAVALGILAWRAQRQREQAEGAGAAATEEAPEDAGESSEEASRVSGVDPLGLRIGFALVPMLEQEDSRLLDRLRAVRNRYGTKMGFIVPPVHVRDSSDLSPQQYQFTIRGAGIAEWEVLPDRWLAIEGPMVLEPLPEGQRTKEPVFRQPAFWISPETIEQADTAGYTVVDASSAIATHLGQVLEDHGWELLGRPEVEDLLARLADRAPKLAEELTNQLSIGTVRRILQGLLRESIPIRDLERIAEALAETAGQGDKDTESLLAAVRVAIGRFIVSHLCGDEPVVRLAVLEPELEQLAAQSLQTARQQGVGEVLEPGIAAQVQNACREAAAALREQGIPPVLAVQQALRRVVARTAAGTLPVIALEEIPEDARLSVVHTAVPGETS